MKRILGPLDRFFASLSRRLSWISGASLVLMMLLVTGNVVLRPLGKPIWGVYELVGFLGTLVISFALIHPTYHRKHMAVEILVSRLPRRIRTFIGHATQGLTLVVLGLIAWQSFVYAGKVLHTGEVSPTLRMPFYPFIYGIAVAFGVAALVVLYQAIQSLFQEKEDEPR